MSLWTIWLLLMAGAATMAVIDGRAASSLIAPAAHFAVALAAVALHRKMFP